MPPLLLPAISVRTETFAICWSFYAAMQRQCAASFISAARILLVRASDVLLYVSVLGRPLRAVASTPRRSVHLSGCISDRWLFCTSSFCSFNPLSTVLSFNISCDAQLAQGTTALCCDQHASWRTCISLPHSRSPIHSTSSAVYLTHTSLANMRTVHSLASMKA